MSMQSELRVPGSLVRQSLLGSRGSPTPSTWSICGLTSHPESGREMFVCVLASLPNDDGDRGGQDLGIDGSVGERGGR